MSGSLDMAEWFRCCLEYQIEKGKEPEEALRELTAMNPLALKFMFDGMLASGDKALAALYLNLIFTRYEIPRERFLPEGLLERLAAVGLNA